MDIDLDQRRGLAGCARCRRDAEALKLYEADHALLRGFQPSKQVVQGGSTNRCSLMILDRYLLVE